MGKAAVFHFYKYLKFRRFLFWYNRWNLTCALHCIRYIHKVKIDFFPYSKTSVNEYHSGHKRSCKNI
jgi:hypothetical protein